MVDRVSVLAFRDYCDKNLIEWSGWARLQEASKLNKFVDKLRPDGGGDHPEAGKTGLLEACKKVEKPTICIMYVDAPPHHSSTAGTNYEKEMEALGEENCDWLEICEKLRQKQMKVYPVFPDLSKSEIPFFTSLADTTEGSCFEIKHSSIIQNTIGILLQLAGVEFEHNKDVKIVKTIEEFNMKAFLDRDMQSILEEIVDENRDTPEKLIKCSATQLKSIDAIKQKIGNSVQRFRTSTSYNNLVFSVFERLLTPDRVMAFTYNTLFGKLWREICAQRKDPRRDKLVGQLSKTVMEISEEDRGLLQAFLDETYDQTDEIAEIVRGYGDEGPFYVIDHDGTMTRKSLFEIGLSCAPPVVAAVAKLLTGLRVTNQKPDETSKLSYIPSNMQATLIFKLLPHLMRPGIMFGMRFSAIMAAIAKVSGSVLQKDAAKALNAFRGKWIDFNLPENSSLDFARLMVKVAEHALTDDEHKHLKALIKVGALKKSKNKEIEVEIAYSSHKDKREDYKSQCVSCKQWRSMTLLLDETCAQCLTGTGEQFVEPQENTTSWMYECKVCLVHYAVYDVEAMRCRAKCHFCRIGEVAPFVTCAKCENRFLYQQSKRLPCFVCAVCKANDGKVVQKRITTVESYIALNGAGFIGMQIDDVVKFFDQGEKVAKMSPEERLIAVRQFSEITKQDFLGHKFVVNKFLSVTKTVWNVESLQQQIYNIFTNPTYSQCMICFEGFPVDKLNNICGRVKKGCSVVACKPCLDTWYNQMAPGRICQPAQLVCPYCKNVPVVKVVRQYNRQLCAIMNATDISTFDPSMIHAWCSKCYAIKEVMRRECGEDGQETLNFTCTDCEKPRKSEYRNCPSCNCTTEKLGGCNHITCTNFLENGTMCKAHWCWLCGILSTQDAIYYHLSEAHRGFFVDDEDY